MDRYIVFPIARMERCTLVEVKMVSFAMRAIPGGFVFSGVRDVLTDTVIAPSFPFLSFLSSFGGGGNPI